MMIFDNGDGVRQQYNERLRELEQERMARQLRRLPRRSSLITRWRGWLRTVLTQLWARQPGRRAVARD